ncbi:hypothetical protein GCM10009818_09830 [Nakamurella flavida]
MTVIVVLALLASAGVALAIVRVTTDPAAAADPVPAVSSPAVEPDPTTAVTDPITDPSPATDVSPGSTTTRPSTTGPTTSPVSTVLLPGSRLTLPSAWRGTADLTIAVLGACAGPAGTAGTSTYRTTADLAVDVAKAGTNGLGDPNPFLLTLGINAAGVPGLALYSAATDAGGGLQRYWTVRGSAGPDGRTEIDGRLVWSDPGQDTLLNLLNDTETDLQPCQSGSTVGLPRALAPGSTVTGWVDGSSAELTVTATTVDGQRSVVATVSAARQP